MNRGKKKILIFIISYKASYRVLHVYQKIPFKNLKNFFVRVLFSDDFSNDDTINYIKKMTINSIDNLINNLSTGSQLISYFKNYIISKNYIFYLRISLFMKQIFFAL